MILSTNGWKYNDRATGLCPLVVTEESFSCFEVDGALEIGCLCLLLEGQQEVHDLPDPGQLGDPLSKLLHVGLQPLELRVLGVSGVPPEGSDGLQQLAAHQVGEVGGPVLADAGDSDPAVAPQGEVPAGEGQLLAGEVQAVDGLMGQQQPLAVLALLTRLLQGRDTETHHLEEQQQQHKSRRDPLTVSSFPDPFPCVPLLGLVGTEECRGDVSGGLVLEWSTLF